MIALAKIAKSYHVCHTSIGILTHCGSYKSTDAGEVMLPFHRQMMRDAPRPASLGGAASDVGNEFHEYSDISIVMLLK